LKIRNFAEVRLISRQRLNDGATPIVVIDDKDEDESDEEDEKESNKN
jgi:hypothetical protein